MSRSPRGTSLPPSNRRYTGGGICPLPLWARRRNQIAIRTTVKYRKWLRQCVSNSNNNPYEPGGKSSGNEDCTAHNPTLLFVIGPLTRLMGLSVSASSILSIACLCAALLASFGTMPSPSEPPASVLVTGASGGIGRAISQAFGQLGWYVGVHYYAHPEEAVKPTASSSSIGLPQNRAASGGL